MTKFLNLVCVCERVCVRAPSTPRPELEESPLIYMRIEEEPVSDVTSALPPILNLHFLWVLTECMCLREILSSLRKESRADTPRYQEVIRAGTDVT